MKSFYLLCISLLVLSGCGYHSFKYIGSSRPPVDAVDIHVDPSTIKRKYEIIGKGYAGVSLAGDLLMQRATEKAREKGADAVFFRETEIAVLPGMQKDSATVYTNAYHVPLYSPGTKREILFLKYTD